MNTDFKDVMSKRTDEELIKIITMDRSNYQALALEAAEEEITKRNISTEHIEKVKCDLSAEVIKQKEFDILKVSAWKRLIHLIVDTVAFYIVMMIFVSILSPFVAITDSFVLKVVSYLITIAAFFCYYVFMEATYQKTIGKFITKTKVVMKDGSKPELGDILARTCYRFIPFDQISYLFTPNGFHDRFSETTIVEEVEKEDDDDDDDE